MSRLSIFDDSEDLSDFAPTPTKPIDKETAKAAAERVGFKDRDPKPAAPAPQAAPEPAAAPAARRYRTGRDVQLNVKVDAATRDRFYALADANGWVLGQTFKFAVEALEEALKAKDEK